MALKKRVIHPKKKGQRRIAFTPGGLHRTMHLRAGKKMTAGQHRAARSGRKGKKAKQQEIFFENVLHGRGRRRKKSRG